jgi:hypothetical protein
MNASGDLLHYPILVVIDRSCKTAIIYYV